MPSPSDDRSSQAIAYGWAARIMTISLEMVVPGLVGYWIDKQLGTKAVFLLAGFALGFTLAGLSLAKIAGQRGGLKADRNDGSRSKRDVP